MSRKNSRIAEIATEIEALSNELNLLLSLQESENQTSIQTDQAPPVTAFLVNEDRPLKIGDTVQLIGSRDQYRGEIGTIEKVTKQQVAIRLNNFSKNPRPTYRYKDKVSRVEQVSRSLKKPIKSRKSS